jgi:hypothetical protein
MFFAFWASLCEVGLRVLHSTSLIHHSSFSVIKALRDVDAYLPQCNAQYWKDRFVQKFVSGQPTFEFPLLGPHPTRGWGLSVSASSVIEGKRYSIRKGGYRGLAHALAGPAQRRILVVGDGLTFGNGLSDPNTWPALVEAKNPGISTFNYAVPGYSLDQMLITMQEVVGNIRPHQVVVAASRDAVFGSVLDFREYKKPIFRDENATLTLGDSPVGHPAEVFKKMNSRKKPNDSFQLLLFLKRSWRMSRLKSLCGHEYKKINRKIVEEMKGVAKASGARFLLLYLASGKELVDPAYYSESEQFFRNISLSGAAEFLNTRPEFHRRKILGSEYTSDHTRTVALLVSESVRSP